MQTKHITFDPAAREAILKAFDKTIDSDGFIVEKGSSDKVLSQDKQEIKIDRLAAIKKGSLLFFRSDLVSLLRLVDRLRNPK